MIFYPNEYVEEIGLSMLQNGMTEEEAFVELEGNGFKVDYEEEEDERTTSNSNNTDS